MHRYVFTPGVHIIVACQSRPAGHLTHHGGTLEVNLQALSGHGALSTLIGSLTNFALFRLLFTVVVATYFWDVTVAFLCLRECKWKRFIGGGIHPSTVSKT